MKVLRLSIASRENYRPLRLYLQFIAISAFAYRIVNLSASNMSEDLSRRAKNDAHFWLTFPFSLMTLSSSYLHRLTFIWVPTFIQVILFYFCPAPSKKFLCVYAAFSFSYYLTLYSTFIILFSKKSLGTFKSPSSLSNYG